MKLKGVPDFKQVTPDLFRGGQPSKEGFDALREMRIDIVVDLRGSRESERREVTRRGMQYVAIPWHCPFPKDPVFARFLQLFHDNPGKRVFVHCRLGDDRTGMMIAAYRMVEQCWSAPQAMKEMQSDGFSPLHHLICPGLASYEKHFPQHFASRPVFADLRSSAKCR